MPLAQQYNKNPKFVMEEWKLKIKNTYAHHLMVISATIHLIAVLGHLRTCYTVVPRPHGPQKH